MVEPVILAKREEDYPTSASRLVAYFEGLLKHIKNTKDDERMNAYAYGSVCVQMGTSKIQNWGQDVLRMGKDKKETDKESGYFNSATISLFAIDLGLHMFGYWGRDYNLGPALGWNTDPNGKLSVFCITDCSGCINTLVHFVFKDFDYVLNKDNKPCSAGDYASANFLKPELWDHYQIIDDDQGGREAGETEGDSENKHITDMRPGDILAWATPGDKTVDTGHVMLVLEEPTHSRPGGSKDDADDKVYYIKVGDCSWIGHLEDDRPDKTGLGAGYVSVKYSDGNWHVSIGGSKDPDNSVASMSILRGALSVS